MPAAHFKYDETGATKECGHKQKKRTPVKWKHIKNQRKTFFFKFFPLPLII